MDLNEIGVNTNNWVDSAQDRDYWRPLVNEALNLQGSIELVMNVIYGLSLPRRVIEINSGTQERIRKIKSYRQDSD